MTAKQMNAIESSLEWGSGYVWGSNIKIFFPENCVFLSAIILRS